MEGGEKEVERSGEGRKTNALLPRPLKKRPDAPAASVCVYIKASISRLRYQENDIDFDKLEGGGVRRAIKTLVTTSLLVLLLWVDTAAFANDHRTTNDLVTPEMTLDEPAAGRRVRQIAPEYRGTEVYHALYLPVDWKPGGKYSVIVEYTGNKFPECGSTGEVKDANLGYGLSGGQGFIWVSMPYIQTGGQKNAVRWWGDRQATIDYCKTNLPRICQQFGGDLESIFICGFSRGAIGASYIGLADDEIASLWKGMVTHDHFDGGRIWGYPESDRKSALTRLARLNGRPVLACGTGNDFLRDHPQLLNVTILRPPVDKIFKIPEGPVIHPHTDLWMHRESRYREQTREWLNRHK